MVYIISRCGYLTLKKIQPNQSSVKGKCGGESRYNILYSKQRAYFPTNVCVTNYQIIISQQKKNTKHYTRHAASLLLKKIRTLECCAINDIDISANFDSNTAK